MSNLTKHMQAALADKDKFSINDAGRWVTNEHLQADKDSIIKLLNASGVQPGDRIVLGYPNSYAFLVTYLAFLEYGAIIVPVNLNMPMPELYKFLKRTRAAMAFLTDQWKGLSSKDLIHDITTWDTLPLSKLFYTDLTRSAVPEKTFTRKAFVSTDKTADVTDELVSCVWEHEAVIIPSEHCVIQEPEDDAIGVIMYTSGTTGKPKAVGLQHRHLLATAKNIINSHQLTPEDVTYCCLPLFHINAQVVAFLSTLLSAGRIVLAERFSASQFWPTIEKHGITWVSAVPTILAILLKTEAPAQMPDSLRFIRSASAQLPKLHQVQFEEKYNLPVIQSYGMTEAASQICVNPLPPAERRPGSAGLPIGLGLKILDETDEPLGCFEIGEIAIQGDGVIDYYEEAESQKDFRDGWFFTGDLGYLDEDGFVYITGRKKEMIKHAGEKVSPYEVEDVIRQYRGVLQVAVIGLPDEMYGERVVAYVHFDESVTVNLSDEAANTINKWPDNATGAGISIGTAVEERKRGAVKDPVTEVEFIQGLMAHCQSQISSYKCPSEINLVSTLPVGQTGKIQRMVLRSQILSKSGS